MGTGRGVISITVSYSCTTLVQLYGYSCIMCLVGISWIVCACTCFKVLEENRRTSGSLRSDQTTESFLHRQAPGTRHDLNNPEGPLIPLCVHHLKAYQTSAVSKHETRNFSAINSSPSCELIHPSIPMKLGLAPVGPHLWDAIADDLVSLIADHLEPHNPGSEYAQLEHPLKGLKGHYAADSVGAAHWVQLSRTIWTGSASRWRHVLTLNHRAHVETAACCRVLEARDEATYDWPLQVRSRQTGKCCHRSDCMARALTIALARTLTTDRLGESRLHQVLRLRGSSDDEPSTDRHPLCPA